TRDDVVAELAADGTSLASSSYLGGSGDEGTSVGVAVDSAGSAYVTGSTFSADFPTTVGAFDTALGGTRDAYVTKLAPNGKSLAYSTYLGGSATDEHVFAAVAVDS